MDSAKKPDYPDFGGLYLDEEGRNSKTGFALLPKMTSAFDSCKKSGGSIFDLAAITLRESPLLQKVVLNLFVSVSEKFVPFTVNGRNSWRAVLWRPSNSILLVGERNTERPRARIPLAIPSSKNPPQWMAKLLRYEHRIHRQIYTLDYFNA